MGQLGTSTGEQHTIAERIQRVSDMYLSGIRLPTIAEECDVSRSTISTDLKFMRNVWLESALIDFDKAKGFELAKIDRLELEYWNAWSRSQNERERKLIVGEPDTKGTGVKKIKRLEKRTENQVGDARFLDGIMSCIRKRCEILGLNAPAKIAPTDPSGEHEYGQTITDKERARRVVELFNGSLDVVTDAIDKAKGK